jgi:hypothetical protein
MAAGGATALLLVTGLRAISYPNDQFSRKCALSRNLKIKAFLQ